MELQEHSNVIVNENFRASSEKYFDQIHPDVIKIMNSTENGIAHGNAKSAESKEAPQSRPTSYVETMMHLFKGNIGPGWYENSCYHAIFLVSILQGCFAMPDAVKNGGLILAPILTLFLGVICVHAQHILLACSAKMKEKHQLANKPDYAETVELCFLSSSNPRWRSLAPTIKRICNIFICVTQLGFCCIYFLFIGTNLKQILEFYGFQINIHLLVTLLFIPIWLSALITNLKYLGEQRIPHLSLC
jgi:solute carrier family 36 (proton-coupled amino acid transporter)